MKYSLTLAICFCWLLCGTTTKAGESNTDDGLNRGLNNVAVDFHSHASQINSTSKKVPSDDHPIPTWIWKPIGHKRNNIESAIILGWFQNDSGSGDDSEDDEVYEEPVPETQPIWTVDESEESVWYATQSPKTMDRKRNETEEKAYLIYERHLRKTNWCFKDSEDAKPNDKFKKAEVCCRRRRECQARRNIKRGIYDCSCDIYFHICLKKADTKMAKSIENMYFNRNIVCYKKQRKVCTTEPCPEAMYMWKIIARHPK